MDLIKIGDIKPNEDNPRTITEAKKEVMKQSLTELEEMLQLKPLILDCNNMILGGNQRYAGALAIGLKEIPCVIFTAEMAKSANKRTKSDKTYKEYCDEILIKDNVNVGDWDWELMTENYTHEQLGDWGVIDSTMETNYEPELYPTSSHSEVSPLDISKAEGRQGNYSDSISNVLEVICPHCGEDFEVNKS